MYYMRHGEAALVDMVALNYSLEKLYADLMSYHNNDITKQHCSRRHYLIALWPRLGIGPGRAGL